MHQKKYLSIACITLVGLLSGCSDNGTNSPIESAPPAADASTAAPAVKRAATLEEVLASPDGGLREVPLDALDTIEAGMSCSLDSVNGSAPGSAPIGRDGALSLSGWFQHKPDAVNSIIAVLRGDRAYAFPMMRGDDRPDVAKVIGSTEAISDVSASTGLSDVTPDEYAIYYVRNGDGGLAKCVADRKIVVN